MENLEKETVTTATVTGAKVEAPQPAVQPVFFATPKYLKLQNAFPKVAAGNSSFLHVSPA